MADTKTNIGNLKFASRTFPTAEDMALWNSLSPSEQFQVIENDEEAGFRSGIAARESLDDRLARVRRL